MSRSAIPIIVLAILMIVFIPSGYSDAASDYDEKIIVHTHKTSAGMELVVNETTKSAYNYIDILTFHDGAVTIFDNNGEVVEYQSRLAGTRHTLNYSDGDEPGLRIVLDDGTTKEYVFKVRKTIAMSDIDPDQVDYITLETTTYNLRVVLYCALSCIMCSVGIIFMFHRFRKKAAEEVRPLG